MTAVNSIAALAVVGVAGIGGYFFYKKMTAPDDPVIPPVQSGRCDNLSGISKELCNLGGFLLGDPLGCTDLTPDCMVNNLNNDKPPSWQQCNWARTNEPTLYQMVRAQCPEGLVW